MTNISDLRSSLEAFRKAGAIDASSYASLVTRLNNTEIEFQSIQKEALAYKESSDRLLQEKLILEQEKNSLALQVTKLSNEKAELESKISVLQKSRPALSSSNLISSFASSLAEMDLELKKVQPGPASSKYSISNMNVTLKTNITLEGGELRFQMPGADNIISPESLSTIEFSLRASPEKPGIESYREVPDIVGLSKEEAENKLFEAGFKTGEIFERESSTPQGTVTAQLPSGGSLAEPRAAVDLTVSRVLSVKVPDLTGLELEAAKALLEKSGLQMGEVKKQLSGGKPGIVLAQSPKPGLEVEANSKVDLIISAGEKEIVLEKPVQPFPGTPVKEPANIIPAEPLPKPEPETISKVSGDNYADVPSASVPAEAPVKIQTAVSPEPKRALVPDVTGMALGKAISLLAAQEIKAGTISESISTAAADTVISQNPGAGSMIDSSVPINLTVSKQAPETQLRTSAFTRLKL